MMRPGDFTETVRPVRTTSAPPRPHWPALDGLRGTAILAVLVCHYAVLLPRAPWVGFLEIGWAGVDLFFVLSGFLITGILIDARGTPHYFRDFYARRALRILPLYWGTLAVLLLAAVVVWLASPMAREGLRQFWAAQAPLWMFTSNYWMPTQLSGPFNPWVEVVIPMWSLSVEEQFYLLWPLVVARLSDRAVARVCVVIIVGALLLRIGLTSFGVDWRWLYVSTPTRADALAADGLLAVLLLRIRPDDISRRRRLRRHLAWVGGVSLALVIALNGGFDPTRHPWQRVFLYTALAGFFAPLLFWAIDPASLHGVPARVYPLAPLRLLGRYSYGLYVLHMPLIYLTILAAKRWGVYDVMSPTWPSAVTLVAVNVVLCGVIAVISFHVYERRFLNLKQRFA